MVIQEESEVPLEVSVMKTLPTPRWDEKKYVIVKNHVRELDTGTEKSSSSTTSSETSSENEIPAKKPKKSRKKKSEVIMEETEAHSSNTTSKISKDDLEELRTVYSMCKSIINKIETKYDHLLNMGASTSTAQSSESNTEEECHCKANKKIIFDEDGQEIVTELDTDNHICPKKLIRDHGKQMSSPETQKIAVQYEHQNIPLPDDLKSLANILQVSDIAISYRNEVINKVKLLKQEHNFEIKFSRPSLIEKLKSQPDSSEIFEFKGANLFSLSGYPDWK